MTPLDPIPLEPIPVAATSEPSAEERTAALMVWLVNIPLHIVGPLIVWWVMGKKSDFVWHHTRASINHTMTVLVLSLIGVVLLGAVVWGGIFFFDETSPEQMLTILLIACVPPLVFLLGLSIATFVIHLVAAYKGKAGIAWTPPLCWRFM